MKSYPLQTSTKLKLGEVAEVISEKRSAVLATPFTLVPVQWESPTGKKMLVTVGDVGPMLPKIASKSFFMFKKELSLLK